MQVYRISYHEINELSKKDKAYRTDPNQFQEFIAYSPDLTGIKNAITNRKNKVVDRELLVSELRKQYEQSGLSAAQNDNLNSLLDSNTFTIITAHQPVLFTGPLYYVTKIFSIINLCRNLQKEFHDNQFVPVFINGGEDHDFEEVQSCSIFGKQIKWESTQTGSVGRFSTEGLEEVLDQFCEVLGSNDRALEISHKLKASLHSASSYNEFVFSFVNALFASYGLLVINMDNAVFKRRFIPIMEAELKDKPSEALIQQTQEKLLEAGFKPQAFVREINLFYLDKGIRERIIEEQDGHYSVNNTDVRFSREGIFEELNSRPERFSPNVVLRPVYQEYILPNIAYIGGGGELAYWIERKKQFEHFDVFFPVLIRRNSLMLINSKQMELLDKLGLTVEELFLQEEDLIKVFLQKNTQFDMKLTEELEQIQQVLNGVVSKAEAADPTLKAFAESEAIKIARQVEQMESRIIRSLKKQEETRINQIRNLKSKLFPGYGLQERKDNYFQFLVSTSQEDFEDELIRHLNPLDPDFLVLGY
jgi:bacillithiol biosynthesis cysteine-adding enzyme BshC